MGVEQKWTKSHKTTQDFISISVKTQKYHPAPSLFNPIYRTSQEKTVSYYKQLISFKVHSHSRIRHTITDPLICTSPALWRPQKRSDESPTRRTINIHSYSETQQEHRCTQTHAEPHTSIILLLFMTQKDMIKVVRVV